MKKFMRGRRAISLALCLSLGAAAFSACSGEGAPASSTAPQPASSDASGAAFRYNGSSPVFEETTTLSLLTCNSGSKTSDYAGMEWFAEITRRANVDLQIECVDDSSYKDVLQPRLAAAVDLPDIVNISGNDADMAYINSGIFIELDDYYEKYGFNLKQRFEEEAYAGIKGEITTPDGKIFYIQIGRAHV